MSFEGRVAIIEYAKELHEEWEVLEFSELAKIISNVTHKDYESWDCPEEAYSEGIREIISEEDTTRYIELYVSEAYPEKEFNIGPIEGNKLLFEIRVNY